MPNSKIEWKIDDKLVPYLEAVDFMEKRAAQIADKTAPQLIWLCQHPPIYTAGISASDEDLLDAKAFPVFKTNRGGKYTHHCPGMQIAYVMLDLKTLFVPSAPDVSRFVEFLENWVINFLAKIGVAAFIRKGRIGIWVLHNGKEKKIGAIGIKLKKWVSYHGIAININPDLAGFDNIVPCGIKEFGVVSLQEMGVDLKQDFCKILQESFYDELSNFNNLSPIFT
jgi:lipoyl(octanoyl) transferase